MDASTEKEMFFSLGLKGYATFEYICRGKKNLHKRADSINKDMEKEIMISDMLICWYDNA